MKEKTPKPLRDDELEKVTGGRHGSQVGEPGDLLHDDTPGGPGPIAETAEPGDTIGGEEQPGNMDRN